MGVPFLSLDALTDSRQTTGIVLAVAGNLLVSVALNVTKHAHNVNQQRAVPLPYVRLPIWWCGFAATLLGELGNFAAYGFAEASVIAPLGAVSVLANAFIASLALGEGFRCRDLLGCLLCAGGGIVIVVSTPANPVDTDVDVFLANAQEPPFVIYMLMLTATVLGMLSFRERFGRRHVGYYVLLCSLLGSVTVMACKGVSTFVNLWLCCGSRIPLGAPVLYVLLFVLAGTAVLQIRYLNLAMEHFGNTETVPVYYVMFTACTIAISNILYKDFRYEDRRNVACFAGGCILTFLGVKLLTSRRPRHHGASISISERSRARGHASSSSISAAEERSRGGGMERGTERGLSAKLIPAEHPSACTCLCGAEAPPPPPAERGSTPPGGSPGWSPRGPQPLWSPGGGFSGFGGFGSPPRARDTRDDADGGRHKNYNYNSNYNSNDDPSLPSLSLLNTPLGMSGDFLRRTFSPGSIPRSSTLESVVPAACTTPPSSMWHGVPGTL